MFLDPAVAGATGREVGRSPRGGVAGLEPRRITGEGRGGAESLPGGERRGRGQRRGPAGGSGGVRQGGRREARSAPPRPGENMSSTDSPESMSLTDLFESRLCIYFSLSLCFPICNRGVIPSQGFWII